MNAIIVFAHLSISFVLVVINAADVDITKGPPSYDKPWVPAWGYNSSNPTLWQKHHQHMLKQTHDNKEKIKVVFFGDSKTYGWTTEGKDVWHRYYDKRGAFNYGIRGDSTRQILWRLEHKELDGLNPHLLVFMIGGNNFKDNYNRGNANCLCLCIGFRYHFVLMSFLSFEGTDEEIVKALIIIIDKLRLMLPKTKLVFVAQLPRESSTTARAKDVNHLLKVHFDKATDKMVTFADFYKNYLNSGGSQNTKLYVADKIHLNKEGYELLAQLLEPTIKKDLNEH